MSTGVLLKKEEYKRGIFFRVLEVTGEVGEARHMYITGSRTTMRCNLKILEKNRGTEEITRKLSRTSTTHTFQRTSRLR